MHYWSREYKAGGIAEVIMTKPGLLIWIALFSWSCSIDRTIHAIDKEEARTLRYFHSLDPNSLLKITNDSEPGQKLRLCLTFIGKESNKPLAHQKVKFYHTSTEGAYEAADPGDESTARLSGYAITNDQGHIFIETILPGDYGSSSDNRHIHTTVENARPDAYDIHFKQFSSFMSKHFISGSDQHFLADLKQAENGDLMAFLEIAVKNAQGVKSSFSFRQVFNLAPEIK